MPFLDARPQVWVAGRFLELHTGAPIAGRHLLATPSGRWFVDRSTAAPRPVLGPATVTGVTDETGFVAVALEAITDDPDIVPTGATWQITDPLRRSFPLAVRSDTPVYEMPAPPLGADPDPRLVALDGRPVLWLSEALPDAAPNGGTVQLTEIVGPRGATGLPGPPLAPPVTLDYAPSIAIDCEQGDHFRIPMLGPLYLDDPTGAPDGHRLFIELVQDQVGGRAVTFSPIFNTGFDIVTVELSPEGGKRDHIGAMFNAVAQSWDVVGVMRGF